MKLPLTPPDLNTLLSNVTGRDIANAIQNRSKILDNHYLHWDQIRRRPPPDGLTTESWWVALKFARNTLYRQLPLLNKTGEPFVLAMPEPVLVHLHHIDQEAGGKIISSASKNIASIEHQQRYLINSFIEEAITSSQLEGASTTRKVAEIMLRQGRKPRDHSERMIFNNYRAMETIRGMQKDQITPERILELHAILTEYTLDDPMDAGRLRHSDDVQVIDNRDGTIIHQPPTYTELPDRLKRLCDFANLDESNSPFIHPVVRAILLHFMIGYDHPFVDGNGRTARALFYWSMARSGYGLMEYISISHFLRKAPAQYVRAYLHTETDDNDTSYFVIHQLEIIRRAIDQFHEYISRIYEQQRNFEKMLSTSPTLRSQLNYRQIALLTHALKHPGETYTIQGHQKIHGVATQTARTDLLGLADMELLIKAISGTRYLFMAPLDIHDRINNLVASSGTPQVFAGK
ncbi:MAG: filamentation induced by cAMP protein fic [Gallionellales bacterium RBG_16_57_15]|nr:MAG: filamentation induced by cAMP protein fic [Gallionellales bacterium RBG_16_57_15]